MTEKQVLEETITKWNESVNDMSKFKFNSKEVDLFCGMLTRFGEMKVAQALNMHAVGSCLRHNEDDMLKAYQAGCIEGQDDCCDFGEDDLKELTSDSVKWYKRFTK